MTVTYDQNDTTTNKASAGDPVAVPIGSAPAYENNNNNNHNNVAPSTSGKATASMVCGIIGILIFGIILGPIAICLGTSAKQDIRASNGQIQGEGQANAGITCGIIAVVIWIIVVIVYF